MTVYSLDGFVKDAPLHENHVTISVGEICPVSPETMRYASTTENLTLSIKLGFTLLRLTHSILQTNNMRTCRDDYPSECVVLHATGFFVQLRKS